MDISGWAPKLGTDPREITKRVSELALSREQTKRFLDEIGPLDSVLKFTSDLRGVSIQKGAILFLFLSDRLATAEADISVETQEEFKQISSDSDFIRFVALFHEIPDDVGLINLAFHAVGTTSIIFKAKTRRYDKICALKLIQAAYVNNSSLRSATQRYEKEYSIHTKHSPNIYRSSHTWILMDFIDGPNLAEFTKELRSKHEYLSKEYVSSVASVLGLLASALSYYEKQDISHGDLNPYNIMVEGPLAAPTSIKLIDFGPNYVLRERLNSQRVFLEAFARTELFAAPEVLVGMRNPSTYSDLYSFGMICLELVSDGPLRKDQISSDLERVWEQRTTYGIAHLIEDVLDDRPENRILTLQPVSPRHIYEAVGLYLDEQMKIFEEIITWSDDALSTWSQMKRVVKPDIFASLEAVASTLRTSAASRSIITRGDEFFCRLNVSLYYILLFLFVTYTATDLVYYVAPTAPHKSGWTDYVPKDFTVGAFWTNLPGRLVAISFAMIATRYYGNIFALLKLSGNPSFMSKMTNVSLRLNSFSYFIPIALAIVWNPLWWPWCAAIGTLFPAFANLLCLVMTRRAKSIIIKGYFSPEAHLINPVTFLPRYGEWAVLMFSYSVAILIVAWLLHAGLALDEPIYGYMVTAINLAKINRNNCGKEAPGVRANLARAFFLLRRSAIRFGNGGGKSIVAQSV